jgi:hypothetical protein
VNGVEHGHSHGTDIPGPINDDEDLQPLLVDEPFLKHSNDYFQNNHLKITLKEDEDYVILSDEAWQYLFKIYGGMDIPRLSIEVEKDDDEES